MKKELLRVGVWNKTVKIPLSRLKEIAQNFNNKESRTDNGYRVPLFIGHPKDQGKEAAVGWLEKVWVEGQSLFGMFADITADTLTEIKDKVFRDVSVGIFENRLDHVALTNNPAVSNLGDFFHKNKNSKIITLSLITEEENNMELQEALKKIATLEANEQGIQDKLTASEAKKAELTTQLEESQKEAKESAEKLTAKETEFNKLVEDGKKAEEAQLDKDDETFVDGLIKEVKLAQGNREITLSNLKAQRSNKEELTCKDADGKEVKKSAVEAYKESLSAAPEIVETGEQFTKGVDQPTAKQAKLTKLTDEYMKENKCGFREATRAILAKNPQLDAEA